MPDALGYRAKIGVLVPNTNTVVEPEMAAMQPPGVTNHISRMPRPIRPTDDMATYRQLLLDGPTGYREAIDQIVPAAPDIICVGHSIDSFVFGLDGADKLAADMTAYAGGIKVVTPAHAFVEALGKLGNVKKLAILTPWMPPADEFCKAFFEEAGYEATVKGMKHGTPLYIAEAKEDEFFKAYDEIDGDDVDVLMKVGTNSALALLAPQIEAKHGKPMLAVNVVTYWHTLRTLGISDKLTGYGQFAEQF